MRGGGWETEREFHLLGLRVTMLLIAREKGGGINQGGNVDIGHTINKSYFSVPLSFSSFIYVKCLLYQNCRRHSSKKKGKKKYLSLFNNRPS